MEPIVNDRFSTDEESKWFNLLFLEPSAISKASLAVNLNGKSPSVVFIQPIRQK
jgi:hypothetical protein